MQPVLTVILWNVFWQRRNSVSGQAMRRLIDEQAPDLVCLTEGEVDFIDLPHRMQSSENYGMPIKPKRRKVLVWSRSSWTDIDDVGDAKMPIGRFVSGTCATPLGPLTVHGVCIPWDLAHVRTGRRDGRPWSEHRAYLAGLSAVVQRRQPLSNTLILGDFNQAVPRRRAPKAVYDQLVETIGLQANIATKGEIAGLPFQTIDHLAHSLDLIPVSIQPLSNRGEDGRRLSDHTGLVIRLTRPAGTPEK
jgi:exonuclease III